MECTSAGSASLERRLEYKSLGNVFVRLLLRIYSDFRRLSQKCFTNDRKQSPAEQQRKGYLCKGYFRRLVDRSDGLVVARSEAGRVGSIIIITYLVGLGGLNHIVADSTTMFYLVVIKSLS